MNKAGQMALGIAGGMALGTGAALLGRYIRTAAYDGDDTSAGTFVENGAGLVVAGTITGGLLLAGLSQQSAALAAVGLLGAVGGGVGIYWGGRERAAMRQRS